MNLVLKKGSYSATRGEIKVYKRWVEMNWQEHLRKNMNGHDEIGASENAAIERLQKDM